MRLFVALQIPDSIRNDYAALIQNLRRFDTKASPKKPKWVRPENLHVTLKFIGHIDPSKLDPIRTALTKVNSPQEVRLVFRNVGFFPNANRPRVVWGGMQPSENLAALAHAIDQRIVTLGVPAGSALSPRISRWRDSIHQGSHQNCVPPLKSTRHAISGCCIPANFTSLKAN